MIFPSRFLFLGGEKLLGTVADDWWRYEKRSNKMEIRKKFLSLKYHGNCAFSDCADNLCIKLF